MTASTPRPDHAREIRYALVDAAHVCERLGLLAGRGTFTRQAGGVIIRCPWHEDRTPSCSVRRGPDGTLAVRCHACGATGDVLTLIAAVHALNTRSDFRQVLRAAAQLAGMLAIVSEIDGAPIDTTRSAPPPPKPQPERTYPPLAEITSVWTDARAVDADAEVSAWLTSRGLAAGDVAAGDLARSIEPSARLPRWASYQQRSWTETGHRLIVPMHDASGAVRSVRACRVVDGDAPKRLPPGGHRATALVMACEIGEAMLRGTFRPSRVIVVEGEPDFLVWATRKTTDATARIGIVTGSWTPEIATRVPDGAEVIVRTDHDAAGEVYARAVWSSLRTRCFVRRGGTE